MYSRRNVFSISAFLFFSLLAAKALTAGTGFVTISGSLQGPIYPCGNTSCSTYDSGQIQITVNGYSATTNYGRAGGQKTSQQLANSLATQLNVAASPVTATVAKTKITLTSKVTGTSSNYSLSTLVTHSSLFTSASFSATPSGSTLTGGTGGPGPVPTHFQQTSNNTSLCSSSNDPGGNLSYCTAFFEGFTTSPNNTAAQTLVVDSP